MIRNSAISLFLIAIASAAHAQEGPVWEAWADELLEEYGELGRFTYGSSWWQEHHADQRTGLLLHFGRPQPYKLADLAKERKAQRAEEGELEALIAKIAVRASGSGKDTIVGELTREMKAEAQEDIDKLMQDLKGVLLLDPVDEPRVPNEQFLDYSYYRRVYSVDGVPGVSIDPDGRFGSAIRFDGTGPGFLILQNDDVLSQKVHWGSDYNMAELSVKVPAYPEKNACIFSAGGGEGRLMLRPDGHLDFVRENPLGRPQKGWFKTWSTDTAFESIHDLDLTLVSEEPVPVNEWFHLAVWRSETLVTNMHTLHIVINGRDVATTVGTPMDRYNPFIGRYGKVKLGNKFRIGNDETGEHPFTGMIDELRLPKGRRVIGDTPQRMINPPVESYEWRDAAAQRPLDFGRPYFYQNGHQWMLDFDRGLTTTVFDGPDFSATLTDPLPEKEFPRLLTEGVRGKALIVDPQISHVRIPVDGKLSMDQGSLEFWLQPLNWDNASGRPKSLPTFTIHMMRIYCETPDGEMLVFPIRGLPNRGGGSEFVFRPGKWTFFCMTWDHPEPGVETRSDRVVSRFSYRLYKDPSGPRDKARELWSVEETSGSKWLPCYAYDLKPLYIEFGVRKPAVGADERRPIIAVDEVVAHDYALSPIEVFQASKRVKGRLERFKALDLDVGYKYGLGELTGSLTTLFPAPVGAKSATITVLNEDGSVFAEPVESELEFDEEGAQGTAEFLFCTGRSIPTTPLTFRIQVRNEQGEVVADDRNTTWQFKPEEWRGNDLGVPRTTPPPWTPINVEGRTLSTLMTQYELGPNGLPAAIVAKGENVLAGPIRLLEDGKPMKAAGLAVGDSEDVQANWSVQFQGETCTVTLNGRIEFDGLTRYELDIEPTTDNGEVAPIRFEIPMKHEHSTHRLFQQARANDLSADGANIPDVYTSRGQRLNHQKRRYKRTPRHRRGEPPTEENFRTWDFWTIMDLCSRDRGLYWFADNAAGWGQSDRLTAQEFRREDDEHLMVLHLVPERMKYTHERPVVFGLIPHPAKPLPADYRYFEKAPSPQDPDIARVYGATFVPLPEQPRNGGSALTMNVYPKNGSWEDASEAKVYMRMMMPNYKTMYLSLAWLSCRAGQYDNWRWRNGNNSKVSLCDSFIEYLSWEMDGWLQRDYYNAIYLDECYAWPVNGPNAVRAGMALEMPDGTVQPGMRLWGFRELMKRWYTLFVKYDHRPMIVAHHSRNWMYPGMVFSATNLDGEGTPQVTRHTRRDFMDKLDFPRFEVVNNPWLWGTVPFYMPAIWENGFDHRGEGTHPPWTWRIARSAIALFAHLENSTVFEVEGGRFFSAYQQVLGEWGTRKADVEFVPWYRDDTGVSTPEPETDALVSFYKDQGRILLIVTNRRKEERDIPIRLDFAKLGLPDTPTVEHLKRRYERPEGIDPWDVNRENPRAAKTDDPLEDEMDLAAFGGSITLEDPEKIAARKEKERREAHRIKLKGNQLIVPVRGHDFRLVSLDPTP